MKILKNFAVFEGCDGSGTTTQLTILEDFFLRGNNDPALPPFYKTCEPTNSIIGKIIRSGLKKEVILHPATIALLFAADRNEHIYGPGGIAEHCERGELVVSDRFTASSLVYQGITCGEELPPRLNRDFPAPELFLFFDIDPETAQKRMAPRAQKEIYEFLEFQVEARRRYKELLPGLAAAGTRVEIIDASPPADEVARRVWSALKKMPILTG